MPIFLKCLIVTLLVLPLGLFLRKYAESMLGMNFKWTKEAPLALNLIYKRNKFLALLFVLEGLTSNLALVGFVLGLPLWLCKGI